MIVYQSSILLSESICTACESNKSMREVGLRLRVLLMSLDQANKHRVSQAQAESVQHITDHRQAATFQSLGVEKIPMQGLFSSNRQGLR
jgi:hypothetical protein